MFHSPVATMVVEILCTVHQLLFWLIKTEIENDIKYFRHVKGAVLMYKVDVYNWRKMSNQGHKLPGVDGYYRLQTASCRKGPATTTASLQCNKLFIVFTTPY